MIDNDMTNILKNFSNASDGTGTVVDAETGAPKASTAAQEKNAMKSLLEGLDAAQKSVNQMPATHTMAKNTDTKHPASKFLVGGEFEDEVNLSQDQVDLSKYQAQQTNEVDEENSKFAPGTKVHTGHMVPGGSGVEGEVVRIEGDKVIIKNPEGKMYKGLLRNTTLAETTVEEDTIAQPEAPKQQMNKKQSLADLFRSMDETEEDMASRFKKELHDEKSEKVLSKGDNGKFNLAEEEDTGWGDEMIEDIKLLLQDSAADRRIDLREELRKLIAIYER